MTWGSFLIVPNPNIKTGEKYHALKKSELGIEMLEMILPKVTLLIKKVSPLFLDFVITLSPTSLAAGETLNRAEGSGGKKVGGCVLCCKMSILLNKC